MFNSYPYKYDSKVTTFGSPFLYKNNTVMENKYAVLQITLTTKKETNDVLEMTEDPDVFCTHKPIKDSDIDNILNKKLTVLVYIPVERTNDYIKFINEYYALDTITRSQLPNDIEQITVTIRTDIKRLLNLSAQIDNIILKYTKHGTMSNLVYDNNELTCSPNSSIEELYGDNVSMTEIPEFYNSTIA